MRKGHWDICHSFFFLRKKVVYRINDEHHYISIPRYDNWNSSNKLNSKTYFMAVLTFCHLILDQSAHLLKTTYQKKHFQIFNTLVIFKCGIYPITFTSFIPYSCLTQKKKHSIYTFYTILLLNIEVF